MRWNNLYSNIQDVNRILAKIDAVPSVNQDALKKQIKGEAYFIRAYDYSTLMMVYGGAVLKDSPYTLDADFTTAKSDISVCRS